jgi:hypothetical protein
VYANRRRVQGRHGKHLLKRRGELIERSFVHCYETGGMRRAHLRGRENILKRQLIHVCGFNLSLIFRKILGAGTPRELKNRGIEALTAFIWLQIALLSSEKVQGDALASSYRPNSALEHHDGRWCHCRKTGGLRHCPTSITFPGQEV